MSAETKKVTEEIKKDFSRFKESLDGQIKRAEKFDQGLAEKIKKVQETTKEVVVHIEKRSG